MKQTLELKRGQPSSRGLVTNLVGHTCYLHDVEPNPLWGRGVSEKPDTDKVYRIVAVYMAEGEDEPTVAVAEIRMGGGNVRVLRMHLSCISLDAYDVSLKMRKR